MEQTFIRYVDRELGLNTVLITCGLPASCKTRTAEVAARLKGYVIISTDIVRLEIFKREDIFDEKVASDMEKRGLVYDEIFRMADELVSNGESIILDATFIIQALRRRAAEIAARNNNIFVILQTQSSPVISLRRISKRRAESYESNAVTEGAYWNNQRIFEAVDLEDLKRHFPTLHILHLLVDTSSDKEEEWNLIKIASS